MEGLSLHRVADLFHSEAATFVEFKLISNFILMVLYFPFTFFPLAEHMNPFTW